MAWVERATWVVLAEAADIGIPEAVAVPIQTFDPLLRGAIRKRVAKAIEAAEERTTLRAGDHVLRLAFLHVHPNAPKELDPNDERAVAEAFEPLASPLTPNVRKARERRASAYREAAPERTPDEVIEAPRKPPKRAWPLTTPLLALVATGFVGGALALAVPYFTPSPIDRFRKTAFGQALDGPLTSAVAGARSGSAAGHSELLSEKVKKQIGPQAQDELGHLLGTLPEATRSMEPVDKAMAPVFQSLDALNARLYEKNVPALLHGYARGYPGDRSLWITSYFVERRDDLVFDDGTAHVVWGRRLDTLNLNDTTVYKADAEENVIVNLDLVEKAFVETLLPALSREGGTSQESTRYAELERVAETEVAREMRGISHVSIGDANDLTEALAVRNKALVLGGRSPKTDLFLGPAARDGLPKGDRAARADAQMHLARKPVEPAISLYARVVDEELVVRVHDQALFGTSVFPKLGPSDDSPAARARVSAAIGLVARSETPHLVLWHLVRKVFYGGGSYERTHAETAILAILRELALVSAPRADIHDEDEAAALTKAFALDAAALRAAGAKAYETLFVAKVPTVVRKPR